MRILLMSEMRTSTNRERIEVLAELLTETETLVNLRQQGRNFAELAVLSMFAATISALAILARPEAAQELLKFPAPFAAWAHDVASMVVAVAFTFLGFDLRDKRREADSRLLRQVSWRAQIRHGQPSGWRLRLHAWNDPRWERLLASSLGALLLAGAVVMLGIKWMG